MEERKRKEGQWSGGEEEGGERRQKAALEKNIN